MNSELNKIRAQLEAVVEPSSTAPALPNKTYTSNEVFSFEREYVLGTSWASLGFTSELPEPGYAKPVDFMGTPVLLIRDKSGEIRVFHNVCSHRGICLIDQAQKVRSVIRCPYHSWSYSCDGQLLNTPNIGGINIHSIDGFEPQDHGLKPIRFAVWMDIIFINLSGTAEPFADYIAPLEKRWQKFFSKQDRTQIQAADSGSHLNMDVKCNWKLPIENYCEAYHLPSVHPDLNRYSPLDQHYNITDGEGMSGQGSLRYEAARVDNKALPIIDGWPTDKIHQGEYISLYPNTLLGIQADHFFALLVLPRNPDLSHETLQITYIGGAAVGSEFDALRKTVLKNWQVVFNEDVIAVEGMQRGRHSAGFDGGVLTPLQDIPTQHFHSWVAKKYLAAM